MTIGIIDYGAGNMQSVKNALDKLGQNYIISKETKVLNTVDKIILPGVGNAAKAMQNLRQCQLVNFLKSIDKPLLGICLGMQLLCQFSEENDTDCLGIIDGTLQRFNGNEKVPKMGWNTIKFNENSLFQNIAEDSYFYFVHSFYLPLSAYTLASANYGLEYSAAIMKGQHYGVQFHPEKSGEAGLQLLQNFIQI